MAIRAKPTTERAARRFFKALTGLDDPCNHQDQWRLILSAFLLYSEEWRGNGFRIETWRWPFNQINTGQGFAGNQPWTVLLRRAVELKQP